MLWWVVLAVVVLLVTGWVVSRRVRGKERYRPNQAAINMTRRKDQGRW
jgi:cytochrome b subunit of formate dehydrogenase